MTDDEGSPPVPVEPDDAPPGPGDDDAGSASEMAADETVPAPAPDEPAPGQEPAPRNGDVEEGAADLPAAGPADPDPPAEVEAAEAAVPSRKARRRDPIAAVLIGVLTLLLGFAFAVQVRNADNNNQALAGAREEDLVRILDEVNARDERLRQQIAEQRTALQQLNSSDSRSATALEEARRRAESIGILNGTVAAHGPGLRMTVRDPGGEVRVADVLDAIEELRGAGAETMQIDGVRVGVSTAVTGDPGKLLIDGHPITAPYEFLVIGSPQNMETAMNIPGGVVQRIAGLGGSVTITQLQDVVVDALRPLDTPQYASPTTGG